MTPKDLSLALRRIASKIDASKNPSKELVMKDIKRIASKLKIASIQIPVAPKSGEHFDDIIGAHVKYDLQNVAHYGEKGYDISGTVQIDLPGMNSPYTFKADAWRSMPNYHVDDPAMLAEIQRVSESLEESTGASLADVLAGCVDHVIREYVKQNNVPYEEVDGPAMDFSIHDNVATRVEECYVLDQPVQVNTNAGYQVTVNIKKCDSAGERYNFGIIAEVTFPDGQKAEIRITRLELRGPSNESIEPPEMEAKISEIVDRPIDLISEAIDLICAKKGFSSYDIIEVRDGFAEF